MSLRADAAANRHHIVETSYHLFKREGFHATGIDKIITEARVAKMTMYRHFPSKEFLIVEVLNWRAKCFARQLDRLNNSNTNTIEKISTVFDWHEKWFESQGFHGCLFQHALAEFGEPDHAVFDAVMRQKRAFQTYLQDILAQSLPADRAEPIALTLFMLIEGATVLANMGKGRAAIVSVRKVAADVLATAGMAQ